MAIVGRWILRAQEKGVKRHRRSPAPAKGDTACGRAGAPRFPMWVAERGPRAPTRGQRVGKLSLLPSPCTLREAGGPEAGRVLGLRVGGRSSRDVEQPSGVAEHTLPFAQVRQLRLSPGRAVEGAVSRRLDLGQPVSRAC